MGMSIEEAIKHCEEVANRQGGCKECADEHRQLAEWLGKLQKIEQILKDWEGGRFSDAVFCLRVKAVLNGNDD